jgi:beta-glucanase (GH16 family)
MTKIKFLYILLMFLVIGCDSSESALEPEPPTDLDFEITISESNPQSVSIDASASNSNFYKFNFGDGSDVIQSNDGSASYTYPSAGNYTIKVSAHTTETVFIEVSKQVEISEQVQEEFPDGYITPTSYEGYDLVWQDEFDGTSLSNDWTHEIGTGGNGWGNNELQYYREQNTEVRDGYLVITAKEENFSGNNYTSSRIITENRQEFQFGRIDIRAVLPEGQGIWPALWMLGANFRDVGWPACGEIDIMEKIGGGTREREVFGTLHWDSNGTRACTCGQGEPYRLDPGSTFGDEFHVFTLLWDQEKIQWLVDDNLYHTIDITPDDLSEFRDEFFFIFNVAVGGNLPGSPDATTVFPQRMTVDYVRVFQKQ